MVQEMVSSIVNICSCFIVLISSSFNIGCCKGSIDNKVSYHEIVNVYKTHSRIHRSVDRHKGTESLSRDFHFQAFNRSFSCHMTPRMDFFSPSFKLKVIGQGGVSSQRHFSPDQVYVGKCNDDPTSTIRGVFMDAVFTGSLLFDGQLYGIENAKHHISVDRSVAGTYEERMIIYRASDIKWDSGWKKSSHGPTFCGNTHVGGGANRPSGTQNVAGNAYTDRPKRFRRGGTPSWNTCQIITVADYKFFREIGEGDVYRTALHMAGVMDSVDQIYRKTVFNTGSPITGLGFEIAEMDIYEEPTTGFNRENGTWDPLSLLQHFSRNLEYKDFCAAHLFTHQAFEGNVLGLAYIAPPREGGVGGICSPVARIGDIMCSLNTGWSSTQNQNGETVLMQQSELVTAHELGHNWGAEHDPDSGDCSPSYGRGKYLMYPYSVSGYDSNNYLFSPCSRDLISSVLNLKGSSCLEQKSTDENQICGNGKLDPGEDCDAGFMGRFMLNKCCDSFCKLKTNATCSPVNHECCFDCEIATAGTPCRSDNEIDCLKTAVCNGISLECPKPENKTDGEDCLDEGKCLSGHCKPFCEAKGLMSCACEDLESSCQRCCRASNTSECRQFDKHHSLPDGRPCIAGYCEGAVCKPSTASTIERLFDILEDLDVDTIGQFFRNNVVGCVIVFSLLLWIPVCLIVSCKDRELRRQRDRNENFEIRSDEEFLQDEGARRAMPRQSWIKFCHQYAANYHDNASITNKMCCL